MPCVRSRCPFRGRMPAVASRSPQGLCSHRRAGCVAVPRLFPSPFWVPKGCPARALSLAPPETLAAHMGALVCAVQPGAGEARRQAPSPSSSIRSARAFVLWYLQPRRWISTGRVLRAFVSSVGLRHLMGHRKLVRCRCNFLAAIARLVGDGLVWIAGRGRRQAIRGFCGEAEMPPVASSRRPRQRRRRAGSRTGPSPPAPQRRRRD